MRHQKRSIYRSDHCYGSSTQELNFSLLPSAAEAIYGGATTQEAMESGRQQQFSYGVLHKIPPATLLSYLNTMSQGGDDLSSGDYS